MHFHIFVQPSEQASSYAVGRFGRLVIIRPLRRRTLLQTHSAFISFLSLLMHMKIFKRLLESRLPPNEVSLHMKILIVTTS
jgi:hypothetical protein